MKTFVLLFTLSLASLSLEAQTRLIGYEDSSVFNGNLHVRSAQWNTFSGNRGTSFSFSTNDLPFKKYYFITKISHSDTTYGSFNDYMAPPYEDSTMQVNSYNANNNLQLSYQYIWNKSSSSWEPSQKDSLSYNSTNNLTSKHTYKYNKGNSSYTLNSINLFTYNNNLLQSARSQSANGTNITERTYSYNNNTIVSEKLNIWKNNSWADSEKTDYIYLNNLLTKKVRSTWSNAQSAWSLSQEYTFSYTNNGHPLTMTNTGWTNGFKNYSTKDSNTYTGNNIQYQFHASGPTWVYDFRDSFAFNTNNDIIFWQTEKIDQFGNLTNYEKTITNYDNAHNPLTRKKYTWDGAKWINEGPHSSVKYHYGKTTSIAQIKNNSTIIDIYPIPTNNVVNYKINTNKTGKATYTITNMNSKILRQWSGELSKGENVHSIPVNELPTGNYVLQCSQAGSVSAKQFVITR
ncbi:MAG: T9SS type A sorting domain-containing protein [Flavipsychrobacter sp.]